VERGEPGDLPGLAIHAGLGNGGHAVVPGVAEHGPPVCTVHGEPRGTGMLLAPARSRRGRPSPPFRGLPTARGPRARAAGPARRSSPRRRRTGRSAAWTVLLAAGILMTAPHRDPAGNPYPRRQIVALSSQPLITFRCRAVTPSRLTSKSRFAVVAQEFQRQLRRPDLRGELPHYNAQNLLARSLNQQCYEHNPGFLRMARNYSAWSDRGWQPRVRGGALGWGGA